MSVTILNPDESFVRRVSTELGNARAKFPDPTLSMVALTEEAGEFANALFECRRSKVSWQRVIDEAVQVAVMAQRVATEGDPSIVEERGVYDVQGARHESDLHNNSKRFPMEKAIKVLKIKRKALWKRAGECRADAKLYDENAKVYLKSAAQLEIEAIEIEAAIVALGGTLDPIVTNEETIAAMEEVRAGETVKVGSVDELISELKAEGGEQISDSSIAGSSTVTYYIGQDGEIRDRENGAADIPSAA